MKRTIFVSLMCTYTRTRKYLELNINRCKEHKDMTDSYVSNYEGKLGRAGTKQSQSCKSMGEPLTGLVLVFESVTLSGDSECYNTEDVIGGAWMLSPL
jgi:hypothetical protein